MTTGIPDLDRLSLFIQRMLDADLLLEEEAAPLLDRVDAAMRSPDAANPEAIRSLLDAMALLVERSAGPNSSDVRAVVQALGVPLATIPSRPTRPGTPRGKRGTSPQRRT